VSFMLVRAENAVLLIGPEKAAFLRTVYWALYGQHCSVTDTGKLRDHGVVELAEWRVRLRWAC